MTTYQPKDQICFSFVDMRGLSEFRLIPPSSFEAGAGVTRRSTVSKVGTSYHQSGNSFINSDGGACRHALGYLPAIEAGGGSRIKVPYFISRKAVKVLGTALLEEHDSLEASE